MAKRFCLENVDMNELYRAALEERGTEGIPEILVFNELVQSGGKIARYVFEDGRSIIYLRRDSISMMKKTLVKELRNGKAPTLQAEDYMYHPLSESDFGKLVGVTVAVSEYLDIPCPQIEARPNLGNKYGEYIPEVNYICIVTPESEDIPIYVRYLLHELRHAWQEKYHPEYQERCLTKSQGEILKYLMRFDEVDAEAFSDKLFYKLFGESTIDAPGYAMGIKVVKEAVANRKYEINVDDSLVMQLKRILGLNMFTDDIEKDFYENHQAI